MAGNHIERKVSVKKQTIYFLLSYKGMGISDTTCVCDGEIDTHSERKSPVVFDCNGVHPACA